MTEGFLYVAIGKAYRDCAVEAIEHLRRFYPDANVHVIADEPMSGPFTCEVAKVQTTSPLTHTFSPRGMMERAWRIRTELNKLTPFDITLSTDVDSFVVRNFGSIEELLGPAAFGAVPQFGGRVKFNPSIKPWPCEPTRYRDCSERGITKRFYLTTFVFHREKARELFELWNRENLRHEFRLSDEISLRLAMAQVKLKVAELSPHYNFYENMCWDGKPYIVHGLRNPQVRKEYGLSELVETPPQPIDNNMQGWKQSGVLPPTGIGPDEKGWKPVRCGRGWD